MPAAQSWGSLRAPLDCHRLLDSDLQYRLRRLFARSGPPTLEEEYRFGVPRPLASSPSKWSRGGRWAYKVGLVANHRFAKPSNAELVQCLVAVHPGRG